MLRTGFVRYPPCSRPSARSWGACSNTPGLTSASGSLLSVVRLVQSAGRYALQRGEVGIEHDPLAVNDVDSLLDPLGDLNRACFSAQLTLPASTANN
jgi:hypothetical protein